MPPAKVMVIGAGVAGW
ncbi:hypothetical protein [Pseudomonas aeruginosa]